MPICVLFRFVAKILLILYLYSAFLAYKCFSCFILIFNKKKKKSSTIHHEYSIYGKFVRIIMKRGFCRLSGGYFCKTGQVVKSADGENPLSEYLQALSRNTGGHHNNV